MGAKVGKSKKLIISDNVNGQSKELFNQHIDGTLTLDRKNGKKTTRYSKQKSLDLRFDKSTATDVNVPVALSSSAACIKHLVNASVSNNFSYDTQSYTTQLEAPSREVLEFREACIRRGIISVESCYTNLPAPIEDEGDETTDDIIEESVVANNQEEEVVEEIREE